MPAHRAANGVALQIQDSARAADRLRYFAGLLPSVHEAEKDNKGGISRRRSWLNLRSVALIRHTQFIFVSCLIVLCSLRSLHCDFHRYLSWSGGGDRNQRCRRYQRSDESAHGVSSLVPICCFDSSRISNHTCLPWLWLERRPGFLSHSTVSDGIAQCQRDYADRFFRSVIYCWR